MPAYALIVEPDPVQAQLYRHLVVAEGFDAKLARDGEQALVALRSAGAPALTITELSLARTDGFTLIGEIRKLASEEHSPVLVISGAHDPGTTPAEGNYLSDHIQGARYAELNASHLSNVEAAEDFTAEVLHFLRQ